MISKSLLQVCLKYLKKTYAGDCKSIANTQWNSYVVIHKKRRVQILTIPGTNDVVDWMWNLCALHKNGMRTGAYLSSQRILKEFIRIPNIPLYIICHSRGCPVGIRIQEVLNDGTCIALEPIKGFTEKKENKNVIMFLDDDSFISKLNLGGFYHRECRKIYLPKDKKHWDILGRINDHRLNHIEEFINNMEEI